MALSPVKSASPASAHGAMTWLLRSIDQSLSGERCEALLAHRVGMAHAGREPHGRRDEELAGARVVTEVVAEDAEAARGVAERPRDVGRRAPFDEGGAEGLVLPVPRRRGGGDEGAATKRAGSVSALLSRIAMPAQCYVGPRGSRSPAETVGLRSANPTGKQGISWRHEGGDRCLRREVKVTMRHRQTWAIGDRNSSHRP